MQRNERYGLRNLKGKKITPVKFDEIEIIDGFDKGLAICTFSSVNLFSKLPTNWFQLLEDWLDRSPYKEKPQRMGVINLDGKKILPLKYGFVRLEESKDFSYFSVSVYQKDYYRYNENKGIYSLEGKEIVPLVFDRADQVDTKNNLIRVEKKQFQGMYDLKGNEFIPAKYDEIQYHTNELFMVKKDGLYGFLDHKGKTIFLPQYTEDQVKTIDNDFFILTDDTNETWKNVKEFQKN